MRACCSCRAWPTSSHCQHRSACSRWVRGGCSYTASTRGNTQPAWVCCPSQSRGTKCPACCGSCVSQLSRHPAKKPYWHPATLSVLQMEAVAAISCGICLFNSHSGNAPSPVTLSADTQLLQATRLLSDVQAAAAQAEAALDHYNNIPGQQVLAPTNPALAAAAAAYLGSSSPGGSSSAAAPQLGAVLFCCQAAVALRALAVDLSEGIRCCRQLHNELLSVLSQVCGVLTAKVLQELHCQMPVVVLNCPCVKHTSKAAKTQLVRCCVFCRLHRSLLRRQVLLCSRSRCFLCLSQRGACTWQSKVRARGGWQS